MKRLFIALAFLSVFSCQPAKKEKNSKHLVAAQSSDPMSSSVRSSVSENLHGGKILILNDKSIWIIREQDIPVSSGWIGPSDIYINKSNDYQFPFMLTNASTKSSVFAKRGTMQDI